jgi:5-methyltetrahydrofolate--homocysteine methyltransferase
MTSLPDPAGSDRPLVADGAMGTALFALGMPVGEAPEAWLLTDEGAAAVTAVHRGHIAAGSQVILASTFGGNPQRLVGSEIEGRSDEVSRAAVGAARAAAADTDVLVAGSMGPTGGLLVPYGLLDPGEVRANYARQAASLVAAGVDVLWVETMMDLREAIAAVEGAREAAPGTPVVATLVFANGRTMFGDRPQAAAEGLAALGVAGIGANCGDGFGPVLDVLETLAKASPGLHLVAKANAGIPEGNAEGLTVYPGTPGESADYARRAADAGATIIGGCCGTTAEHLRAIVAALA